MSGVNERIVFGWDGEWERVLQAFGDAVGGVDGLTPARVLAAHREHYRLHTAETVEPTGTLRSSGELPVVGDWVVVGRGGITAVLPRRTLLRRAFEGGEQLLAANVDLVAVVTSLNRDLNVRRLERFLALAQGSGIKSLVLVTKGDLSPDPDAEAHELRRFLGGTEVLVASAHDVNGLNALRARLPPGTTTGLLGMSGVGKSTLVNVLLGEERQRTLPVRERDDKGRHATTHRELFVLDTGALIIDTPGIRRPQRVTDQDTADPFDDVTELAAGCRFADCRHETEPGCAVRAAIAGGALPEDRLLHQRELERAGASAQSRQHR